MKACDVFELQKSNYEEPSFFVEYFNFGRELKGINTEGPRIVSTKVLKIWRIVGDKLLPVNSAGILFSYESFIIQWTFEYILTNNELKQQTIFFNWRGINAGRGLSPVPENFDNDNAIVKRIVQWSEPAIFFQIFAKPIIVLNEKFVNFDPSAQHMFMVQGELTNELHLYEVAFLKKNLRSRGIFLIVLPEKRVVYTWKGSKITKDLDLNIQEAKLADELKQLEESWRDFNVLELKEKEEYELFQEDTSAYFHVEEDCNFSPRLFYLNSVTGEFLATEVEYPLRSKSHIAAFPFLQSHLDTGDQPGLFLLDNHRTIWLIWNGLKTDNDDVLYQLGEETAKNYAKLKEQSLNGNITVKFVNTHTDLLEFTNIFPYWN